MRLVEEGKMASSSVVGRVDDIVLNVDFQRRPEQSSIFASEVQVVPGNIAWEDLELMLKIFSGHQSVKVSYFDDDNDPIVIESEEELQESFNVARKCNNTLRLIVICENEARDLFDLEREPPVAPHNNSPLLEMSPGKVLYRCGLESPELLMPRGVNIDSGLECDGEAEERTTAGDSVGKRSFFVINKRCPTMVLDVEGGGLQPGASVIVWYRKRAREGNLNQLWYEDCRTATIRTRLNDFCLDVVDGRLVVNPCDLNSIGQKWTISGNRIQNIFNQKWVIGLKKNDLHACDQVLGLAEDELTNTEWIIDDHEMREFCRNVFVLNFSRPDGVDAICDNCDQPITGVRYKCGYCLDFDLCASCESKEGVHDPTHLLLKMQVPQDQIQLKLSALEPVLMRNASGLVVAAPGKQIIELRMSEKNAENEEQRMLQIMNQAEEIVQKNPQLKEPVDEAVVSHSKSDDLSMNEDLLDTKLNQLKMNLSTLAVPTNTPLVDTPPQTPMVLELDEKQTEGRGVNEVPLSCEESPNHVNMAIMADLVHKKMSDIVTDGEYEYVDVERVSNSSGSTSDFYVVPIPDCFNPRLPARKEASTSVIVKKSAVLRSCSLRSVDDMLSTSNCLATEALLSPKSCFSVVSSVNGDAKNEAPVPKHPQQDETFFEMDEIKASVIRQNIGASVLENIKRTEVEISEEAAVGELEIWQTETVDNIGRDAAAADSCGSSDMNEIVHENEANQLQLNEEQQMQRQQEVQHQEQQEVVSRENGAEANVSSAQNEASAASGGVEASTMRLMSSVFSFVAKTAKGVYNTIQDKNSYLPAPSNWTPAVNQWTPTTSAWTPQPPAWSPSDTPQWNPEPVADDAPFCPAAESRSPMDQLIEMGFADRQLNQQLLQSHGNNIEMVIQRLVEMNGNIR